MEDNLNVEQPVENANSSGIENKKETHKTLKVWSIVLFVFGVIFFAINLWLFVSFKISEDIGKAVFLVFFFPASIFFTIFSIVPLIVSAVGFKKLMISKILTFINTAFTVAQILFIVFTILN